MTGSRCRLTCAHGSAGRVPRRSGGLGWVIAICDLVTFGLTLKAEKSWRSAEPSMLSLDCETEGDNIDAIASGIVAQ